MTGRFPAGSLRAFTLIELLVVVAIIAILMAILLPSLAHARDKGKESVCKSNLRQFGIGASTYANENREYTCSGSFDPEVSNGRDGPVDKIGWVADQVNTKQNYPAAMLCPGNPARYNQKLGPNGKTYNPDQARDLVKRGYNTNYTQTWYMGRSEWNPNQPDGNTKRVRACYGPLRLGKWGRISGSIIPMIGDGRSDTDDIVLGERSVKTMTDGPFGGPYGLQNYADIGPAHGIASYWIGGKKDHNRIRASVLFSDGRVDSLTDLDRDGEFAINGEVFPPEQKDLKESQIFDGTLSIGRRSLDDFQLR